MDRASDVLARTHALSGAVAWLAVAPLVTTEPAHIAAGAGIAAGAALAADLDHRSGTATHAWGPITRILGGAIGAIAGGHRNGTHTLAAAAVAGWVAWASITLAGGWPAMFVVALCCALAFIACEDIIPGRWERVWPLNLSWSVAAGWAAVTSELDLSWLPWAVVVGWVAHIAGDMVTAGGVPLFAPISPRRYRLTRARTGGTWETVTAWLLVAAGTGLGCATTVAYPEPWPTVIRSCFAAPSVGGQPSTGTAATGHTCIPAATHVE